MIVADPSEKVVVLGVLFRWTAAAFTDRLEEVEELVRRSIPTDAPAHMIKRAQKPFRHYLGIVRYSAKSGCYWFRQGGMGRVHAVHPAYLSDRLRALVVPEEPRGLIQFSHALFTAPKEGPATPVRSEEEAELASPVCAERGDPRNPPLWAGAKTRVLLRDMLDTDYRIIFEHMSDPASARMAAFGTKDPDPATLAARWKKSASGSATTRKAILLEGSNDVLGFVSTFLHEGKLQVTYWIARSHWGRGIASAALSQFLESVTARPVYASAAKDNAGSLRVLEKCGFRICGTEKAFANARGEEVEEVFLELVQAE